MIIPDFRLALGIKLNMRLLIRLVEGNMLMCIKELIVKQIKTSPSRFLNLYRKIRFEER